MADAAKDYGLLAENFAKSGQPRGMVPDVDVGLSWEESTDVLQMLQKPRWRGAAGARELLVRRLAMARERHAEGVAKALVEKAGPQQD